uniref:(northern house mosquito) hypothetical protein n=1 Tax=Culex pipiens TaxID=7175 RepID=A0A8D8AQU3_CULPI
MCLATYNPGSLSLALWYSLVVHPISPVRDCGFFAYLLPSPELPCPAPPPGEKGFRSIPSSPHLVSFDASRQCTVGRKFHPTSPSYHHHHHLCAGCWKMMKSLEGAKKNSQEGRVAKRVVSNLSPGEI